MINKKKKSIFDWIMDIILIALSLLIIVWLIQLIFGGSPGLSEFNFALIILISGFFIKLYREIGEMKVEVKYSFERLKNDMELIKNKLKIK